MPTYEYVCNRCQAAHEAVQKISDPPLTTCPACGEEGLERLVSQTSFSLKGEGWYADGYGAKKSNPPAASTSSKPKSEPKSETKTETKSETKSEAKPASTTSGDSSSK